MKNKQLKETDKQEVKLDLIQLKKGGFLKQKQKDMFILRLRFPAGQCTDKQLIAIANIVKKYGKRVVHFSIRQEIELQWIDFRDFDKIKKELRAAGIKTGACGPRTRNVVGCTGNRLCKFGLLDSMGLAIEMDRFFFGKDVPKKFKISVSGCPNSCVKPQVNDIGFMGVVEPYVDLSLCTSCGLCEKVCVEKAIIMKDGFPTYNFDKCTLDGDCIRCCPVDAWKFKRTGFIVFVGGKIGRHPMFGYRIADFVNDDRAIELTRKSIEFYNKYGNKGERFGALINRIGLDRFKREVL